MVSQPAASLSLPQPPPLSPAGHRRKKRGPCTCLPKPIKKMESGEQVGAPHAPAEAGEWELNKAPRAWVGQQDEAGCGWKAQVLGPQGRNSSSNYLMAGAGFSDRSYRA